LGVTLKPAGSALARKVESACGKPLDVQYADIESRGTNRILSDGTPYIRINPSCKYMLEELLVHELGHLQLAIEGFPRYDWTFDLVASAQRQVEQRQLPNWIALRVFDPMEHRIFYPRLKRMGYHPTAWRVEEMKATIARDTYGPDITATYDVAARFCQVAIELGERATVRRMELWYRQKGWSEALALGCEAYSRVQHVAHWIPATTLAAFVEVSNVLLRPLGWTLESGGMRPKTFGRVVENFGQIHIIGSSA
jgi:hypothetical protein